MSSCSDSVPSSCFLRTSAMILSKSDHPSAGFLQGLLLTLTFCDGTFRGLRSFSSFSSYKKNRYFWLGPKSISLPEFQNQIVGVGLEMPQRVTDFEGDYLLVCDQSFDHGLELEMVTETSWEN